MLFPMPKSTRFIYPELALSFNAMTPVTPQGGTIIGSGGEFVSVWAPDVGTPVLPPDPQGPDAEYLKALSVSVLTASKVEWTATGLEGAFGAYPQGGGGYDRVYIEDLADQVRCGNGVFSLNDIYASFVAFVNASPDGDVPEGIHPNGEDAINFGYSATNFNLIDLAYSHFLRSPSPEVSAWAEYRLGLKTIMEFPPTLNHLCYLEGTQRFWGFEGATTGYALYGSLLRYRAYRQAAEMETAVDGQYASAFAVERDAIKEALETYLWDSGSGYFLRCSGEGTRHVAGTAYAVVLGACSPSVASAARASLIAGLQNTTESGFEFRGHMRMYPVPDAIPIGDYGTHWGCFTGTVGLAVGEPHASLILGRFADYCRELGAEAAPAEIITESGPSGIGIRYSASAADAARSFYGVTDR
jgi:hypothetical protein